MGTRANFRRIRKENHKEVVMNKKQILEQVMQEKEESKTKSKLSKIERSYKVALGVIERLEKEAEVRNELDRAIDTFEISPIKSEGTSEGTIVCLASDWHVEEVVKSSTVNGLNQYNPAIAKTRVESFFQILLRLIQIESTFVKIPNLVLALLGDFFSNDIHEEFLETNDMPPVEAIMYAESLIVSGIQFLLKETDLKITLPCHSGNHARDTEKTRTATEAGHSFEFYMYHNLAKMFAQEPRVQFVIPDGYHSYMDIYGLTFRFHHGHAIRYGGGIGGIYIPVNKAIAQWNKAKRADVDCFGHFHQLRDGGNFLCNGSLIGWNGYALSIKADFERPKQAFTLVHNHLGRILTRSIVL